MPSKRQTSARKSAKRLRAVAAREKRLFDLKRKKRQLLPTSLLRALADSGLPNDPQAYTARLRELLESV